MTASLVIAVLAILLLSMLWIYKKIIEVSRTCLHSSRFFHLVALQPACEQVEQAVLAVLRLHILPPCVIQGHHKSCCLCLSLTCCHKNKLSGKCFENMEQLNFVEIVS